MKNLIVQMLGISLKSYYNWKNSRLIITFLEKYFSESELQEFLETKKIKRLELIKGFTADELEYKTQTKKELKIDENTLKLLDTVYSFAYEQNKLEELKKEFSIIAKKYI